eukprot:Amastigsp_a678511_9.p2 type:complete len:250 gc:universal Amastigsp_a678511_9:205-954(+)
MLRAQRTAPFTGGSRAHASTVTRANRCHIRATCSQPKTASDVQSAAAIGSEPASRAQKSHTNTTAEPCSGARSRANGDVHETRRSTCSTRASATPHTVVRSNVCKTDPATTGTSATARTRGASADACCSVAGFRSTDPVVVATDGPASMGADGSIRRSSQAMSVSIDCKWSSSLWSSCLPPRTMWTCVSRAPDAAPNSCDATGSVMTSSEPWIRHSGCENRAASPRVSSACVSIWFAKRTDIKGSTTGS